MSDMNKAQQRLRLRVELELKLNSESSRCSALNVNFSQVSLNKNFGIENDCIKYFNVSVAEISLYK